LLQPGGGLLLLLLVLVVVGLLLSMLCYNWQAVGPAQPE
jgi:hypothetical protein